MMSRKMAFVVAFALLIGTEASGQEQPGGSEPSHGGSDEVEAVIRAYLDDFAAQDATAWREHVVDGFLLIENGYPVEADRFTAAWDPSRPYGQSYELHDLHIAVVGKVALYRFELGWYEEDDRVSWGIESGHARFSNGRWRLAQNHMTWLPPQKNADPQLLEEVVGEYEGVDLLGREDRLILFLEEDVLYMRRPDGAPLVASVSPIKIIPSFDGAFFAEFVNGMLRFERDASGVVRGFIFTTSLEFPPGAQDLRYQKVR